jgi:hypothetical protein
MKKITIENLIADDACDSGIKFAKAALDAGLDPAMETIRQGVFNYFKWLVVEGYDLEHLRTPNFTWDSCGIITSVSDASDGTSASGFKGKSTSGDRGTSISGEDGTSISGFKGKSTSGKRGTSISGSCGTSISGEDGTSISGFKGKSTSCNRGTSISGSYGTSISYESGTCASGNKGTLIIKFWDGQRSRFRMAYVGEDGILPDVHYKLDDNGDFVRAE